MGSKFHFSRWRTNFSQFIYKFLKFEVILFTMFEMCTALFHINYLSHLHQRNLNYNTAFPNLSINSNLGFLSVGLTLSFLRFPHFTKMFWDFRCCCSWTFKWKIFFFNISKTVANSLNFCKVWVFQVSLISYFVRL